MCFGKQINIRVLYLITSYCAYSLSSIGAIWLIVHAPTQCSCQNFARRTECYRCAVPKSEKSLLINSNDPYSDAVICDPSVEVVQLPNSVLSTNVERFLIESVRDFQIFFNRYWRYVSPLDLCT